MRLQFGIDDEDAFYETRRLLLDELTEWSADQHQRSAAPGSVMDSPAEDAAILLDWRFGYSTGELDRFTAGELREYLLEWCPRKLSFPPELWRPVMDGARLWIEFLVATDRWAGGLLGPIFTELDRIGPEFLDAMADPGNFGLAKGLFMSPVLSGAEIDPEDPESLAAAIDAFNALPESERKALTDPFIANVGPPPKPVELTIGVEPDPSDVLAAAERAPIVAHLAATIDYIGIGRGLTKTGNLKLVDARRLLAIWETDDVADHTIGDHEYKLRSAADLVHLDYLLEGVLDAGALRKQGTRIVPVKKWQRRDPVEQVTALFEALVTIGPVAGRAARFPDATDQLVEEGLGHWTVPLLYGETVDVDAIVEQAVGIVDANVRNPWWRDSTDIRDATVARLVEHGVDVIERCGLVTRTGHRMERDRYDIRDHKRGGELQITAIGRQVLPPFIERAGYRITSMGDAAELDAAELLDAMDKMGEVDLDDLWRRWLPDRGEADKAKALVGALLDVDHPSTRLNGFALLDAAGSAARAPAIELLETRLADHAALFLIDNGLMAEADVLSRLTRPPLGPMVDVLAAELDIDQDEMIAQWTALTAGDSEVAVELIEQMWRVDLPEALDVLEALGRHVEEKAVARAAKKAAFKFRTRST